MTSLFDPANSFSYNTDIFSLSDEICSVYLLFLCTVFIWSCDLLILAVSHALSFIHRTHVWWASTRENWLLTQTGYLFNLPVFLPVIKYGCTKNIRSMVSSLVLQRLDYGNATLAGIPSHLTKPMQSVLNSSAWLVFSASRYDRITPLLANLHWLKVPERIKFKLAFLVYRCLHRQLRRTLLKNSICHLLMRLVSVSARHRHHRLLSHAPVFQPSAIELFQSLLSDCGTLCRWTSRQHRQYLFSGNIWRPISSVILSLNLL